MNQHPRKFSDPLDEILDRPIAFNPAFKRITGSTNAALFLSQTWYWSKRHREDDGWFFKTQTEWEEETGLTRYEQETARQHCKKAGVIEEKLKGVPATMYYRVNKEKVYSLLGFQFVETPHTQFAETPQTSSDDTRKNAEIQQSGSSPNINNVPSTSSMIPPETSDNDDSDTTQKIKTLSKLYSENVGAITSLGADLIRNMAIDYPESWYKPAFEIAVKNNARNLNYIDTILRGWKDHEFGWKPVRQNARNKKQEIPPTPSLDPAQLEKLREQAIKEFAVP